MSLLEEANSRENWDKLWGAAESRDWRKDAMRSVYDAIIERVPFESRIVDLGGGVGHLGKRLRAEKGCRVVIVDLSPVACALARDAGLYAVEHDLRRSAWPEPLSAPDVVVATELLEHLDDRVLADVMGKLQEMGVRFFASVPDDRLGPDTCKYHARKWDLESFEAFLTSWASGREVRVNRLPFVQEKFFLLGEVR